MRLDISDSVRSLYNLAEQGMVILPKLLVGLVVFGIFYLVGKGVRAVVQRVATERRRHRNLALVLGRLTQAGTIVIGLLLAMVITFPSFQFQNVVEILGLGSVAIGFAFRDVLQNFLAGVIVLLTEPFKIGDQVIVTGFEGTVIDIQTRATIIRTYDGRRVVMPNTKVFTESVLVNTANDKRRGEYVVGIGYGDDIGKAKLVILEAVRGIEGILEDPAPEVLVAELSASNVNLRVWWWTEPPQRIHVLHVHDKVLEAIKTALVNNGIDLPFPTQQVLFHDQTEDTDGDRSRQREGWPTGSEQASRSRSIAGAIRELSQSFRTRTPDPARPGADDGRDDSEQRRPHHQQSNDNNRHAGEPRM